MKFNDETRFRLTELGKQLAHTKIFRSKKIWEQLEKTLSQEEIDDWQKLENIHPAVGLTQYEQDRMLNYMIKAGLIEIIPEEAEP